MLTVFQISWFRVVSTSNNGKLDLLKALALEASALLKTLLCVCEFLTLNYVSG